MKSGHPSVQFKYMKGVFFNSYLQILHQNGGKLYVKKIQSVRKGECKSTQ